MNNIHRIYSDLLFFRYPPQSDASIRRCFHTVFSHRASIWWTSHCVHLNALNFRVLTLESQAGAFIFLFWHLDLEISLCLQMFCILRSSESHTKLSVSAFAISAFESSGAQSFISEAPKSHPEVPNSKHAPLNSPESR